MAQDKIITKIYPPYPVKGIMAESSRNTICDTLRKAYRGIEAGEEDEAKLNIRIAITMAKAMVEKLRLYKDCRVKEMFPKKEGFDRHGRRKGK